MHKRSLLTLIIGISFAAMIGALLPLYTASVDQLIMTDNLTTQPPENTHIHLRTTYTVSEDNVYSQVVADIDQQLEAVIEQNLGEFPFWHDALYHWAESASAFVLVDDVELETKASIAYYEDFNAQIDIVAGALPAAPLQALIDQQAATQLNLKVGDVVTLDQRGWETSVPFEVTIAGIVTALDNDSPYFMTPSPTRIGNVVNLFVSADDFEQVITDYMPEASAQFGWRIFFDHNALYHGDIDQAITAMTTLEADIQRLTEQNSAIDAFQIQTDLITALEQVSATSENLNTAFVLVLLQVGALVLFFIYVMGAMIRRVTTDEIDRWRSRGGDNQQLLLLLGAEFFAVCLIAAIVAPFIVYVFLLFYIPLLTDSGAFILSISIDTFGFSLLWSGFAFVILLLQHVPLIRRPLTIAEGSRYEREDKQPLWQRLYLDVIVLGFGLVALIGGFNDSSQNAESLQNDPLFLILPTILFFAIGSLLLRLFPIATRIATRVISTGNSLTGLLAAWQVSRSPRHYAQISLLLALSISMGWFALSFQVTLLQNQSDQANYATGADIRLRGEVSALPDATFTDTAQSLSEAVRYRDIDLAPNTQLLSFTSGDLLMVDEDTLPDVVNWRDDLGVLPLPEWNEDLPAVGRQLPENTVELVIELQLFSPQASEEDVTVFASDAMRLGYFLEIFGRLRAHNDLIFTVPFQVELPENMPELPDQEGFFEELPETDIETLTFRATVPEAYLEEQLRLDMLNIVTSDSTFRSPFEQGVILAIESIEASTASGENIALDWASTATWQAINDQGNDQVIEIPEIQAFMETYPAQTVAWIQRDGVGRVSIALDYPIVTSLSTDDTLEANEISAIPAVLSQRYAQENELDIGQKFRISVNQTALWLEVMAITPYFPTLYDAQAPYIVVPMAPAVYNLNRNPFGRVYANELWLDVQGSPSDVAQRIREEASQLDVIDSESVASGMQNDFFTLGLIGLLLLSALIGITLSLLSLITYTVLNTGERQNEFAVLRALGWTNAHVVILGLLEQSMVLLVALIIGLATGVLLNALVLPGLSITADGASVVPPFRVEFSPEVFMIYIGVLLIVFLIQFLLTVLLVNRMTLNQKEASL